VGWGGVGWAGMGWVDVGSVAAGAVLVKAAAGDFSVGRHGGLEQAGGETWLAKQLVECTVAFSEPAISKLRVLANSSQPIVLPANVTVAAF
jgi:hypothetical protein